MLDVAVAYNRYKFLGCEFLTWLWFLIENNQNEIKELAKDIIALEIGNRIVLENRRQNTLESITIKGDEAGLEEGILALKKGAYVKELNLYYKKGDKKWIFTIKGESLNLSGLTTPETSKIEINEDVEGVVIEKILLYNMIIEFLDKLFKMFIKLRVSTEWKNKTVPLVKKWIYSY